MSLNSRRKVAIIFEEGFTVRTEQLERGSCFDFGIGGRDEDRSSCNDSQDRRREFV